MDTNIKYLVDNGINIWNKDAFNYSSIHTKWESMNDFVKEVSRKGGSHHGEVGRGYGAQLRGFMGYDDDIDQLADLIHILKTNPMATKKTVTFWNPAEKNQCALTPCHWSFEVLVEPLSWFERTGLVKPSDHIKQKLDIKAIKSGKNSNNLDMEYYDSLNIPKYQFTLKWHQHSVDTFLGLPFNIASYALLAHIIGKMTNMVPKGIIGDLSNVHIYEPHLEQVKEQLSRDVNKYGECNLTISTKAQAELKEGLKYIDNGNIKIKDFMLLDYESYPRIPAEMLAYSK